jgi:cephalosporin hydroxylase
MQANPILIGTGFYATPQTMRARYEFFQLWLENTKLVSHNIVVADNAEPPEFRLEYAFRDSLNLSLRFIKCNRNLGHAVWPIAKCAGTPLLGWSLSWMLPALVAYADGCDYIYKEQDCLAFGDWLPRVRQDQFAAGRNSVMPCEQSLFFLRHDFILPFMADYIRLGSHDCEVSTEDKFKRAMELHGGMKFHDLPGGRERPLPFGAPAWYAQNITQDELAEIAKRTGNSIQGWFDYAPIYDRMVAECRDGGTIIELGVWKGRSLCYLARKAAASGKNINVIGIDSFAHSDWDGYAQIQRLDRAKGETRTVEEQCRANLAATGCPAQIIKSDAIEAAGMFADGSVDFVFVDDTHNSEHVAKELAAWIPKMRRPTWIAGHDYPGDIAAAVNAALPNARADGNCFVAELK